jgi:hypothetical protein
VLTNYVGELAQHDTSLHLWSPFAEKKWYLITTLDDHSRRMLYGELWEKETSWAHIVALKAVVMQFGCPLKYYVDNHAIFRFIERRDTMHQKASKTEAEALVQWKEVLKDLGIETVYALSPAAKGKIERPYRWLQDHLVRTCAREKVTDIEEARKILYEELYQYNYKRVHSTTKEIPDNRYCKAIEDKKTMFRPFKIRWPYEKPEDIFCYRAKRIVNPYRKISLSNLEFSVSGVPLHREVELRISFDLKSQLATIRFWYDNRLVGEQQAKAKDLRRINF